MGGLSCFLSLDDKHPCGGVGVDDLGQVVKRAGLGERLPAPRLLARGMTAPGDGQDFLGAIG